MRYLTEEELLDGAAKLAAKTRLDPSTGCIVFIGGLTNHGYGQISVGSRTTSVKNVLAHRLAWRLSGRTFDPDRPFILHNCDNPACCNPEHLRQGTPLDNNRDMAYRRRGCRGAHLFGARPNKKRWRATLWAEGKNYFLGNFSTEEEASACASEAHQMYYDSLIMQGSYIPQSITALGIL